MKNKKPAAVREKKPREENGEVYTFEGLFELCEKMLDYANKLQEQQRKNLSALTL